jgi:hypothetical protein
MKHISGRLTLHGAMIIAVVMSLSAADVFAQSDPIEEVNVRSVVIELFDAMRAGDGERVRSLFHPIATMGTAVASQDSAFVRFGDVDRFADAVGGERTEAWDERIRNLAIHIDGLLATAWMEYAFFVGERFSHCGANAMTFLRGEEGWSILAVIDTRQTDTCEPLEWR